jgi:hypothetical protein
MWRNSVACAQALASARTSAGSDARQLSVSIWRCTRRSCPRAPEPRVARDHFEQRVVWHLRYPRPAARRYTRASFALRRGVRIQHPTWQTAGAWMADARVGAAKVQEAWVDRQRVGRQQWRHVRWPPSVAQGPNARPCKGPWRGPKNGPGQKSPLTRAPEGSPWGGKPPRRAHGPSLAAE